MTQAGTIPYRIVDERIEFCLITSSSGKRWGFPKGIVDPGETDLETALKETDEEAGLRGRLIGEALGEYAYRKWGTTLTVSVFLMEVQEADEVWLESEIRERRWARHKEARELLAREELVDLLNVALARLGSRDRPGTQ